MHELGISGVSKKKKPGCYRKQKAKVAIEVEDHVKRNFKADSPNKLWFADITYVKTDEGWLYLAVVFDIFSRLIVGWAMQPHMTATLVDSALKMAIQTRKPKKGIIHHSDHGTQYISLVLGKTMREHGIVPSMGSIQSPWDNAVTESLMSTIKAECVRHKTYSTREEAELKIFDYIETFYNRQRLHSALGYASPVEYEAEMAAKKSAV